MKSDILEIVLGGVTLFVAICGAIKFYFHQRQKYNQTLLKQVDSN